MAIPAQHSYLVLRSSHEILISDAEARRVSRILHGEGPTQPLMVTINERPRAGDGGGKHVVRTDAIDYVYIYGSESRRKKR